MLTLSVRQPYAELILRGVKTVEYRSRPTRRVGERFYIYASLRRAGGGGREAPWSTDLGVGRPPEWMVELARQVGTIPPDAELPTGVIVGSAVVERVSRVDDRPAGAGRETCRWHLVDVRRAATLRTPDRHPQPVWFRPF